MIDTTEIEVEADTERVMETILLMPTETIKASIEAPISPVN